MIAVIDKLSNPIVFRVIHSSAGIVLTEGESSNLASCIYHYDSNGNVVLLTDSEGKEAARYAYDAFGKTMLAAGPMAQENKYRFSTKPVEEASGLCFYGYRYYAPELGRWTAKDPLGEAGGINLLGMVGNRPATQPIATKHNTSKQAA